MEKEKNPSINEGSKKLKLKKKYLVEFKSRI